MVEIRLLLQNCWKRWKPKKMRMNYLFIWSMNLTLREWNFGVFIVHMEGMREQLRGRDFEEHTNWVFNTHPDKVPSFKELMRAALIALVRCCTKVLLWEKKIMGMNKRKKRKLDKEKKLEQMVLKMYWLF